MSEPTKPPQTSMPPGSTKTVPDIVYSAAQTDTAKELVQPDVIRSADDPLAEMSQFDKVQYIATQVLAAKGARTPENTMSGSEIYSEGKRLYPKAEILENTFSVYLSKAVRTPSSQINCLGRKQGYYLSDAAKKLEQISAEPPAEPEIKLEEGRREKERLLYPLVLEWLMEQEYRAKVTASGRAHGWWGNPDITGIICDEAFGNLAIEVATIEVKLSEKAWKQWIFEAVSHRRFANRSYFAFAHPAELVNKLDPDLRYFSELYQIGILVITMEQKLFEDLQAGAIKQPIASEDVDILERYSAPYAQVPLRFQKEYLEGLKISSVPELARWGEGLEDEE